MTKPVLIGTSEAAKILGVKVPQITRLRNNGKMPTTACYLAATDLWHRADVLALKRGKQQFSGAVAGLLGVKEAADMLKVNRSAITRWRRLGQFPEPAYKLIATDVWERDSLQGWIRPSER